MLQEEATETTAHHRTSQQQQEQDDEETPWIDAWIRWERGDGHDATDVEDEQQPVQVVATDTFSFHYTAGRDDDHSDLDIELRGFPSDSEQTWNSTGLTLWRSSEHLCDYFVREWRKPTANLFSDNARFLEVGSGLGRSGILVWHCLLQCSIRSPQKQQLDDSAKLPQHKLLCLTDGDTDVLHHLRSNVRHNQPKQMVDPANVSVQCAQLLWGRERALAFLERVDKKKFDVLFGSDLVYVTKVIKPLFETVATLLNESGCFIMAHCTRRQGNQVEVEMLLEVSNDFGLTHSVVEQDGDITVFVFRRKS